MKREAYTAGAVLIAVMMVWAAGVPTPAPGRWVKLAAFPEPAEELYGAAAGGKIYVIGNRLHLVSGDVQSAGIPNVPVHSDAHDAFEIVDR